jgi:methionyl-tRNA formyltransferase
MLNKKIVFLGSPRYAVEHLKGLWEKGFNIVGVITQPDKRGGRGKKQLLSPPVKKFAMEHEIPLLQPENINTDQTVEWIKDKKADVLVVVAYGQILRRRILRSTPLGVINVHPSLLPHLRGAAPLEWALLEGLTTTGVTIMKVNLRMDAGKVYSQESFPIEEVDTIYELYEKAIQLGKKLLSDVLEKIFTQSIEPFKQDESRATYCKKMDKHLGKIDFTTESAWEIWNKYRALLIWPQSFFEFKGKMVKLIDISLDKNISETSPGKILEVSPDGVLLSTPAGGIRLKVLKPEGKREILARDWLNGVRLKKGDYIFKSQ